MRAAIKQKARQDVTQKRTGINDERDELEWLADCHKKEAAQVFWAEMRVQNVECLIDRRGGCGASLEKASVYLIELAAALAWYADAVAAAGDSAGKSILPRGRADFIRENAASVLPQLAMEAIEMAAGNPARFRTGKQVGQTFGVTFAERQAHKLWMVRPADLTDEEFVTTRHAWNARRRLERRAAKRADTGMMRRDEYIATSDADLARRYGVERRSIARWKAKGILDQKLTALEIKMQKCARSGPHNKRSNSIGPTHGTFGAGGLKAPPACNDDPLFLDVDWPALIAELERLPGAASPADGKGEIGARSFDRAADLMRPPIRSDVPAPARRRARA